MKIVAKTIDEHRRRYHAVHSYKPRAELQCSLRDYLMMKSGTQNPKAGACYEEVAYWILQEPPDEV